jgi:hypothetical protein
LQAALQSSGTDHEIRLQPGERPADETGALHGGLGGARRGECPARVA